MNTHPLAERARHSLIQTRRALQTFSYFAAFIPVLIAIFADPRHRIALLAIDMFDRLFNLIIR